MQFIGTFSFVTSYLSCSTFPSFFLRISTTSCFHHIANFLMNQKFTPVVLFRLVILYNNWLSWYERDFYEYGSYFVSFFTVTVNKILRTYFFFSRSRFNLLLLYRWSILGTSYFVIITFTKIYIYRPEPHILLFRRPLGTDPQSGRIDPELAAAARDEYRNQFAIRR